VITLPIATALARNWWLLLIRGILAVLFGLMAFAWPALTLVTLVLLYGAFAFVDGLTAIWVGVRSRTWGLLFFGILGVVIGVYTLFYPRVTAIARCTSLLPGHLSVALSRSLRLSSCARR
jgi:uncharacterized membrane protein HdeD (DUF308 family)